VQSTPRFLLLLLGVSKHVSAACHADEEDVYVPDFSTSPTRTDEITDAVSPVWACKHGWVAVPARFLQHTVPSSSTMARITTGPKPRTGALVAGGPKMVSSNYSIRSQKYIRPVAIGGIKTL
jgi:hypothetical protein